MTIGAPRTWATNDLITATVWNNETRDQANALMGRPAAMLVKTIVHEFATMKDSYASSLPMRCMVNLQFDQIAYDRAYDGSTMAYGSTIMANIPGWYRITAAHYWDTVCSTVNGPATPLLGTRQLAIQVNSSGRFYSVNGRNMTPEVSDAVRYAWREDAALSQAGSTALVQPVKVADTIYLNRGDYVEMFAGQDSGNDLRDYVINADTVTAGQGAAGFTAFMSAVWMRQ